MNADELKKADEIVRALRDLRCGTPDRNGNFECGKVAVRAADLIDSLTAQLSVPQQKGASYWKAAWEAQCNENKLLYAQLAASRRREKAAVVLREGENPDGTTRCSCPTCGRLFQEEAFVESYCPDCGQRLTLSGPQEAEKGEVE